MDYSNCEKSISVHILGYNYDLSSSLFSEYEMVKHEENIDEIGLSDVNLIPEYIKWINCSIERYPKFMWDNSYDVYLLLQWLGYKFMWEFVSEASKKYYKIKS